MPEGAARAGLGQRGEVMMDALRARVDVLSPMESAVLAGCRGLGTLDELAARAAEATRALTRGAARGVLADLVKRGVLTSEAELARLLSEGISKSISELPPTDPAAAARREQPASISERISAMPPTDPAAAARREQPASIAVLGIPTRDRPASLRRALASYAEDIAERGRAIEIVVLDDATVDPSATATREAARDIARRFGVRVRVAGRAEKERFADAIAKESGAPLEVVRRALTPGMTAGFAAGAARNALLLDAVGQCSLQVDDDTLCDLRRAPGATEGRTSEALGATQSLRSTEARCAVRSFEDPTEMWFDEPAPGGEGARGYAELHESMLGQRAGELAVRAMHGEGADLGHASAALLARMANGARVMCTQLGVRGDSAMGSMGYVLTLGQPSRARLLSSEATYRRAMKTRRLVRAVTAPTVTDMELCMTLAIGLDGRAPLPPFPPTHRNEDGLFGTVLAACDPCAVFGHLPWTIAHEPEDVRPSDVDAAIEHAGRVGANDLIAGLVSASRSDVDLRSQVRAFESLGRALVAWCDVPEDELYERLSWMLARRLAQRLARIDHVLRESRGAPLFWVRDLDRLADVIRERVEEPERAVPYDLIELREGRSARAEAMQLAREYGEILMWWPAMLEGAARLRDRGARLGEEGA